MYQTRMHPSHAARREMRALKTDSSDSFSGGANRAGSVMVTMPADTTERYFSMSPFAGINEDLNDDRLDQQG